MGTSFLANLVICSNSPIQQYVVSAVEMALFQKPEHQEVIVLAYWKWNLGMRVEILNIYPFGISGN